MRTRFGEIDLLFENKDEVVIVEVKSQPLCNQLLPERVSRFQAQRLANVLLDYSHKFSKAVRAHLAVVSQDGSIQIYEDFLCELI